MSVRANWSRRSFIACSGLSIVGCGSDEPKPNEPGAPAPRWQLEDVQPMSERFGQVYGLEAFRGSVVLIALYAGWCNTCVGVAPMLSDLVAQFTAEGLNVRTLSVNAANARADQQSLIDVWPHPLFQDTPEIDAWGQHAGTKDDMIVYTPDGVLSAFLRWGGEVEVYPFTDLGKQNIRNAIVAAQG